MFATQRRRGPLSQRQKGRAERRKSSGPQPPALRSDADAWDRIGQGGPLCWQRRGAGGGRRRRNELPLPGVTGGLARLPLISSDRARRLHLHLPPGSLHSGVRFFPDRAGPKPPPLINLEGTGGRKEEVCGNLWGAGRPDWQALVLRTGRGCSGGEEPGQNHHQTGGGPAEVS